MLKVFIFIKSADVDLHFVESFHLRSGEMILLSTHRQCDILLLY